jgi:Ala-tRNA(Pro) deacylase
MQTETTLLAFLASLDIAFDVVDHPPVFTVDEARTLRGAIPGAHSKNLFVKDKKGRLFLLVARESAVIDLKRVHEKIGAQGRLSFGSAERLENLFGVKPGAVTPFGAINDRCHAVTIVLEQELMAQERLNFHPLVNTRTIGLSRDGLLKFLAATGHQPVIVPLDEADP